MDIKYIIAIIACGVFAVIFVIFLILNVKKRREEAENRERLERMYRDVNLVKMDYDFAVFGTEGENFLDSVREFTLQKNPRPEYEQMTINAVFSPAEPDGVEEITGTYNPDKN